MLFKNIVGQSETKAYFSKIVREAKVPHAILLTGGEGYGKLPLALGLATLLQCTDRQDDRACGKCSSCRKAIQNIHPDIHYAFPVIKLDKKVRAETTSKDFLKQWRTFIANNAVGNISDWLAHLGATDKQANINVAECNYISKNLGLKTYEGGFKVQIIWYADLLGKEGNRLLKLIEEPTPDTIIILICHNRNALLNTLLSRCQIVSVPPLEDEDIHAFIKENFGLSPQDQKELAFLSSGNIRKASVLGQQSELNYSEELLNWLRISYKSDPEDIKQFIDFMSKQGRQYIVNFLEYGLHFFREYLLGINISQLEPLRLTQAEKSVVKKMSKIIDQSKTMDIEQLFSISMVEINRNLSTKILLMHMTMKINNILRSEVNNFVAQ